MDTTVEQAQQELDRHPALIAEAQQAADDVTAELETAQAEEAAITKAIAAHDGRDGLDVLAANRSTAAARVESLSARLAERTEALKTVLDSERKARVRVAEATFDAEQAEIARLDAALGAKIGRFIRGCFVEDLGKIAWHLQAADAAGANTEPVRYARSNFGNDRVLESWITDAVAMVILERLAAQSARANARHKQLRERWNEEAAVSTERWFAEREAELAAAEASDTAPPPKVTREELERIRAGTAAQDDPLVRRRGTDEELQRMRATCDLHPTAAP